MAESLRSAPLSGEDLLFALADEQVLASRGLTSHQLAAVTGRKRGLTDRVVDDLCAVGLLERDPATRLVRLGWGLYAAAARIVDVRLAGRGQTVVDQLARRCGESAYVVIRQGSQSVTIAEAQPDLAVQGISWVGRSQPVSRGDAGPVLLMDLSADDLRAIVGDDPLPPTPARRAPRTLGGLRKLIEQSRRDGVCVLDELIEPAVASISAPVWDFRGRLAAAVAAVGPAPRMRADAGEIADHVRSAAAELTCSVGGQAGDDHV